MKIQTITDYEEIPKQILFNLKKIEELGILRIDMAKKLISKNLIEHVKIGNKIHISRVELIRFLQANTIPVSN